MLKIELSWQSTLTAQSNQIKGQGLADAAANFQNPLLAPSSGTSLGMSAQNAFDPATGAIEKQQQMLKIIFQTSRISLNKVQVITMQNRIEFRKRMKQQLNPQT